LELFDSGTGLVGLSDARAALDISSPKILVPDPSLLHKEPSERNLLNQKTFLWEKPTVSFTFTICQRWVSVIFTIGAIQSFLIGRIRILALGYTITCRGPNLEKRPIKYNVKSSEQVFSPTSIFRLAGSLEKRSPIFLTEL
jgi:hypothetical protein